MITDTCRKGLTLTVNGQVHDLHVDPDRLLVDVLREDLDLTGAKKACDGGECGSCTVLLGGRAVMSCLLAVGRVGAKEIVTIEGLAGSGAGEGEMHPLQRSFVELGAAQCGFCIPGMIMEASALLKANPNPSRANVISRLSRNTCRCTGYTKIIDAVLDAAEISRGEARTHAPAPANGLRVGARVGKPDGLLHVNGRSKYAADLKREGMLYAKILRSPHHHARILSIDTSEAEAMAGVRAVITHKDIPGRQTLTNCRPQVYLLSKDTVRFLGEAVAAVAAESEEIASAATRRIKVEYEALPPVFDPVEAMRDDAPRLHAPLPNWVESGQVTRGDVEQGFAEADVIVEGTYVTAPREHAAMEPEAALVYIDETGRFVFHSPHHHPFTARLWLADMLAVDPERVRVIVPAMGGNFGMRGEFLHCGVAGLLVLKTGRPVRIVYTREESMMASGKSYSFHIKCKTGARKDGKITAFKAEVIANGGAWVKHADSPFAGSALGARVISMVPGPYDLPAADVKMFEVCTNQPRSCPMRGTNQPDFAFAIESQMEMLAGKLGIDPLEFRIMNAIELNDKLIDGRVVDESVSARATMEALRAPYAEALARAESEPPAHPWRRGVGLGSVWKFYGGARGLGDSSTGGDFMGYPLGEASAAIEVSADGKFRVLTGAVEKGQGITIALAQIAAETLDVPLDALLPTFGGDTLLAPYPQATNAQRTTVSVGGAVIRAARLMRQALIEVAADIFGVPVDNVDFVGGWASAGAGRKLSVSDLAQGLEERGLPRKYVAKYTFEKTEKAEGPIFSYGSMLIELDVNVDDGRLKVGRVTFVADPGRVINPLIFEGQVEGGIVMGLGYAMGEQFVPGETTNLKSYGLPMIKDSPESVVLKLVEQPVYGSPYGAKGGGETPSVPGMAAVANAIAHATGRRPFEMPARLQGVPDSNGGASKGSTANGGRRAPRASSQTKID